VRLEVIVARASQYWLVDAIMAVVRNHSSASPLM